MVKDNDYTIDTDNQENDYLTFLEVYKKARAIIGKFDNGYISIYNQILNSGELGFSYENEFSDSAAIMLRNNQDIQRIININRSFDYNEVRTLVHEFIHYTAGHFFNYNRYFLAEFLAIYFEMIAVKELAKNDRNVDYFFRLKTLKKCSNRFYGYGIILFAYISFGNINQDTYKDVHSIFNYINADNFSRHCRHTYKNFNYIKNKYKCKIEENPEMEGKLLTEEFMSVDYLYIVGVSLAIYAHQYCDYNAILYLNNHLSSFDNMDICDVLNYIGIDMQSEGFLEVLKETLLSYTNDCYQQVEDISKKTKVITK